MRSLLALSLALLAVSPAVADDKKLNVLFILSDDMRPDLGCYGHKTVKSPNLDALAKAGVRFDRSYCQYPLCNPSRTSFLTGRHPTTTGVYGNREWFGATHPDWVSLPRHFKENGYATLRAGKIFHGGIDDTEAWTVGGEPRLYGGAPAGGGGPRQPTTAGQEAARLAEVSQQAEFTPRDVHMKDERVKLVFAVKLAIQNPQGILKPGMPVDARLRWDPEVPWGDGLE